VLLLDDLHWADAPTLETLAFLAPLLGSARVLVAGTYRDVRGDWANDLEATLATVVREPVTQQVGLVGLQPDAVATLAERVTGEQLSPAERELLHERTGGNPFFVRQLSQLLSETDEDGRAQRAIPRAITHVIARRLSRLPADVRGLLERVSVVGPQFDVRWLAGVTGSNVDAALDAADVAAQYGLVEPLGRPATTYRFVHALVRETIYDSVPPVRAARIHAHVATAMEQTPQTPVTALAEHFWRASDVIEDDRPVRYLRSAASEALAVFAYEQAEGYLRQALQLLMDRADDPATELQVRMELVQLLTGSTGGSPRPSRRSRAGAAVGSHRGASP
jgi:predicted ATPase